MFDVFVDCLSSTEWRHLSESAHLVVFDESRPAEYDRIDYALVVRRDQELLGYATVRELDRESVYWQFGGAFPGAEKTVKVWPTYQALIEWTRKRGYKRITTLVENENVPYLRLAHKAGFRICGIRICEEGRIFPELRLKLEGSAAP